MSTHSPYRRRSDALKVTVSLCFCYTLCFFLVGMWLRVKSRSYKWDDTVALSAMILSVGQLATQYAALALGQGRSTEYLSTSSHLSLLNSVNRAGVILFFLTLYTSKAAAVAFHYRFALSRRQKLTVLIFIGFMVLLGVVSVLLLNISCGLTGILYWHISRKSTACQNQYMRWQITTAFDLASEILILLLPIDIIWSLQMKTKTKIGVIGRFWVRIIVLAPAVGRFAYIRNLVLADDASIASNETIIMQEIEMAASLTTTVIITLRPFAKDLNTNFGQGGAAIVAYATSKIYDNNSGGAVKSSSRTNDRGLGSRIANRLGLSSKGGSMMRHSGLRSSGIEEAGGDVVDLKDWKKGGNVEGNKRMVETSESVKDLTRDVITQTIDFQVEYEDSSEEDGRGVRVRERL